MRGGGARSSARDAAARRLMASQRLGRNPTLRASRRALGRTALVLAGPAPSCAARQAGELAEEAGGVLGRQHAAISTSGRGSRSSISAKAARHRAAGVGIVAAVEPDLGAGGAAHQRAVTSAAACAPASRRWRAPPRAPRSSSATPGARAASRRRVPAFSTWCGRRASAAAGRAGRRRPGRRAGRARVHAQCSPPWRNRRAPRAFASSSITASTLGPAARRRPARRASGCRPSRRRSLRGRSPRNSAWSMAIERDRAGERSSITLVASKRPPRPTSSSRTSAGCAA